MALVSSGRGWAERAYGGGKECTQNFGAEIIASIFLTEKKNKLRGP
jgi:hypothetical protein